MQTELKGLSEVCSEYQQRFCVTMSRGAFDDIKAFLLKGIEDRLIIEAIELAAQRGASWQYAKAIILRLEEKGIKYFGIYRVHQELKRLKARFRYCSEDDLMPFAVINAYRYLPEFRDIDKRIEEFIKEESLKEDFNKDTWIERYVEKD